MFCEPGFLDTWIPYIFFKPQSAKKGAVNPPGSLSCFANMDFWIPFIFFKPLSAAKSAVSWHILLIFLLRHLSKTDPLKTTNRGLYQGMGKHMTSREGSGVAAQPRRRLVSRQQKKSQAFRSYPFSWTPPWAPLGSSCSWHRWAPRCRHRWAPAPGSCSKQRRAPQRSSCSSPPSSSCSRSWSLFWSLWVDQEWNLIGYKNICLSRSELNQCVALISIQVMQRMRTRITQYWNSQTSEQLKERFEASIHWLFIAPEWNMWILHGRSSARDNFNSQAVVQGKYGIVLTWRVFFSRTLILGKNCHSWAKWSKIGTFSVCHIWPNHLKSLRIKQLGC